VSSKSAEISKYASQTMLFLQASAHMPTVALSTRRCTRMFTCGAVEVYPVLCVPYCNISN
jgi:hypothetical protein